MAHLMPVGTGANIRWILQNMDRNAVTLGRRNDHPKASGSYGYSPVVVEQGKHVPVPNGFSIRFGTTESVALRS
jgi:hypothetical protein